jgi:sugar lactone lactonase YvrE
VSDEGNCRIRKISAKGIITTVAGTGICGYSGDGGPAKSAMIRFPIGLVFDGKGNLLFSDVGNSRIRKISTSGTITTIAGNGTSGYSGDGGLAIRASLANPQGISVDPLGNLYIADSSNYVIRMVDTAGIIHTVAGNHTRGFSGDGGPATSAQISAAVGVLADGSGSFYIADGNNQRVRKVDSTGTITTYAGNGQSGNGGNGGPATSASIGYLQGLLFGGGKLYIGTAGNVWEVDVTTQVINLVAGNVNGNPGFSGDGQVALSTSFSYPLGMAFDAGGNLLIVDSGNDRVRKIDASQVVTTIAGGYIGDGHPAVSASLLPGFYGGHIAFDPAGNLYIADTSENRVRKASTTGIISTLAGTGITGYSGDGGPASAATLNSPSGVAADGLGNVFIADLNNVIRKVDSAGTIITLSNTPANALAVDASGNVYAAGLFSDVIWKVTPDGSATVVAGVKNELGYNGDGIPATQAWLFFPAGIAVDNAGNLYIADWLNNRIRKVDTNGIISTVAGNGMLGYSGDGGPATAAMLWGPLDVSVDAKGNIYLADTGNYRVRVVDSSGTINALAGTGSAGYNGNRLAATSTNISPTGINVSPKGVLYVTDLSSSRVRKIH